MLICSNGFRAAVGWHPNEEQNGHDVPIAGGTVHSTCRGLLEMGLDRRGYTTLCA